MCKESLKKAVAHMPYSRWPSTFYHGILSLMKYFLCVVGPPLDMYCIIFCV